MFKKKWCVTFAYRPPCNSNKDGFLKEFNNITRKYDNVVGDLNIDILVEKKIRKITDLTYLTTLKSYFGSYMRKVIGRFLD